MATRGQYLSEIKFPLTVKPLTSPDDKLTFQDVFNLQNSFRLLIGAIDEWISNNPGGGGGGMTAGQGVPTEAGTAGEVYVNTLEVPATTYGFFDAPSANLVLGGDAQSKNTASDFIDVAVNIPRGASKLLLIVASEGSPGTFDVDSAKEELLDVEFEHIETIREDITTAGPRNMTISLWAADVPQSVTSGKVHVEFTEPSTYGTVAAVVYLTSTGEVVLQDSPEVVVYESGQTSIQFNEVDFPVGTIRLLIAANSTNNNFATPANSNLITTAAASLNSHYTRLHIWKVDSKLAYNDEYTTSKTSAHAGVGLFVGIAPNPEGSWTLFQTCL